MRAQALGITPDPLNWDLSGQGAITTLLGTVDFLGMVTGVPTGGVVLDGAVGAGDITLVFQLSLDASSEFELPEVHALFGGTAVATGSGWIPGPDADVEATSIVGQFTNPNGLEPGETFDPVFISFSTLSPGDTLTWEFVLIQMGTQTVTAPEPSVAVLGLTALIGGGLLHRRRSRRR